MPDTGLAVFPLETKDYRLNVFGRFVRS